MMHVLFGCWFPCAGALYVLPSSCRPFLPPSLLCPFAIRFLSTLTTCFDPAKHRVLNVLIRLMFAFDAYSLWRSAVGTCTCGVSCAVCMNALSGVLPHVVARRKRCITNYLAPFEQISETHGNSRFTAKDIHKFGKAPSLITRLHKNDVIACRESLMIYLTAEGRLCFLFDFLIRHLRCRTLSYLRRCYWDWKRSLQIFLSPPARWESLGFNPAPTTPHHTELPASSAWTASLLASHLYTATLLSDRW